MVSGKWVKTSDASSSCPTGCTAAVAAANAAAKWTTTAVNTFAEEEEPIRTLCCFVLPTPFLIDTSLATYSPACQVSVQSGWRHCRLKTSKGQTTCCLSKGGWESKHLTTCKNMYSRVAIVCSKKTTVHCVTKF